MSAIKKVLGALRLRMRGNNARQSYGQFGEDALIQWLLKKELKLETGTYVDVGSYHPMTFSNTYALYQQGWGGLVIDPNPHLKSLYSVLRPRDTFVEAAIGKGGMGTYFMFEADANNTFDRDEADKKRKAPNFHFKGEKSIAFKPLSEILHENAITEIAFLNIDIEGGDMDALATHDWSIRPRVIAVEDRGFNVEAPHASATYRFLADKKYDLVGKCGVTLVWKAQ